MAKAWVPKSQPWKVRARGRVGQKMEEREQIAPDRDEDLAQEMARELNRRFMLGDLSWLAEPRTRGRKRSRAGRSPTFKRYADQWLEEIEGQIEGSTLWSYRSAVKAW